MPDRPLSPFRARMVDALLAVSSPLPWTAFILSAAALTAVAGIPPGRTARLAEAAYALLPPGPHLAGNLALSAGSVALAAAFIASCLFTGRLLLRWAGTGIRGAEVPAGFLVLSSALLGAGLSGLWFRALVVPGLLLPALGLLATRRTRAAGPRLGAWTGAPPAGRAGFLLLLAWWLLAVTVPDLTVDAATYHLALPAQSLLLHRLAGGGTFAPWMMPLPADLPNALPLALGLEPAGRATGLAVAVAGALFFVRSLVPAGARLAPPILALAVVVGLTAPEAAGVLGTAKGDQVACGWVLAGAGFLLRGALSPGMALSAGLLLGAGAAAKWVSAPLPLALLAVAFAGARAGAGPWLAGMLGLVLPALPWLVRSWLAFGDPLPPVGSAVFPALFPGPAGDPSASRFAVAWRLAAPPPGFDPAGGGRFALLARNCLLPLSALALLLRSRAGGSAVAAALTAAAIMVAGSGGLGGHADRYAYPAFALSALAAAALLLARPRRPRFLVPAFGVLALLFHLRAGMPPPWGDRGREARAAALRAGRITPGEYREAGLGSFGRLLPRMREAMSAKPGGRVLATSALLFHGIPAPVLPDGDYAPPFAWKAANESATPGRTAIRLRQAGVRWVLYDPDLAYWKKLEPSPWAWNRRMIALWDGFFRSRFGVAAAVPCSGPGSGAALIFRLLPLPGSPDATAPYLPGAESAFHAPALLASRGEFAAAECALRPLMAQLGKVGDPGALMGHLLLAEGRYAEALPLLREAEARGVAGCAAPVTLNRAVAAGRAGLKAEAGDALRRAALNMPEWPARIEQARKDAGL